MTTPVTTPACRPHRCSTPAARPTARPLSQALPELIPPHEARHVAQATRPEIADRQCGETPAETAYRLLTRHAQAVVDHCPVDPIARDLLTAKILQDLSEHAVAAFGFPVMTTASIDWIAAIIGARRALEVGAGPALISAELQARNVAVMATDPRPPQATERGRYGFAATLTHVEELDALSAIEHHEPDVLIWSWPEMDPHTDEALDAFVGTDVVYVGEPEHGCTGSLEFHEILNERFTLIDSFTIPQYPNRHDRCHHFSRRQDPAQHDTTPAGERRMDDNEPCYQPLSSPISTDGQNRDLTADEARNLLQLGVNLLTLDRTQRRRVASHIWDQLGFDHCSAAVAMANSCLDENRPPATV